MSVLLKARERFLSTVLRQPSSLQAVSQQSYELCPAEMQIVAPAICLARDVERITGVEEFTTVQQEMRRIRGGKQFHGATVAYELSDVTLSDGFLFKAGWKERLLANAPPSQALQEHLDHGTLTATFFGGRYFGHWMTDDLTLAMAAEKTGDPVALDGLRYHHAEEYQRLLHLQPYRVAYARFDRLTILEDIGQNSYKRERYQQMRARLAAVHRGSDDASAGKWVFLHRGGTAAGRLLENQADIEELLERLGFLIVDPAKLSAEEIVKACGGAEIVISVEGSQLAHPLYTMAPGGVLCALQPPYRLNNVFKDYADCIGLRYGLLTGEPAESGFRVSLDEIRELVDRLARSVTAHKSDEPAQGIPIDWIRKENREPGVSCR